MSAERSGLFGCHRGHSHCCHCGAEFSKVEGTTGVLCRCSTVNAELVGGPSDGTSLLVPLSQLDNLPLLSKRSEGKRYHCYSTDFLSEDVLRYYWGPRARPRIGINRKGVWVGDLHLCWRLPYLFTGFCRNSHDSVFEGWTLGLRSLQLRHWRIVPLDFELDQQRAVETLRQAVREADARLGRDGTQPAIPTPN